MSFLQQYTQKLTEIELLKTNNIKIFKELENLETELAEIEVALKAEVKEKGDIENKTIKATRIERWKKYYNYNKFINEAKPEEIGILKDNDGIKTEIVKSVFDDLVEQGKISKKTKQKCFKEELLNIAVSIKSKI